MGEAISDEAINAINGMVEMVTESLFMAQVGAGLTCREAETVATFLSEFGTLPQAKAFIEAHAGGDDDEHDQHHDLYLALTTE